ncbi:hypothetical protein PUN28_005663 [Cardiocondyla obscurior]|uniref:Uncharacterized protein n=1 Tax=Cardiocondyla obscurior TaxID=286306 RepID=A0AAW2G7U2_9HYME
MHNGRYAARNFYGSSRVTNDAARLAIKEKKREREKELGEKKRKRRKTEAGRCTPPC